MNTPDIGGVDVTAPTGGGSPVGVRPLVGNREGMMMATLSKQASEHTDTPSTAPRWPDPTVADVARGMAGLKHFCSSNMYRMAGLTFVFHFCGRVLSVRAKVKNR